MTQEEKAKAYDEAIERAKKWYNAPNIDKMPTYGNRVIEEIFPELKESEDEKMMHQLHSWMKEFGGAEEYTEKVYTWLKSLLEKQGKETSWKPSKEEMDVLYGLAYITNQYDEHKEEVITRLYQDLKREFFNGLSYENMFHNTEDGVRRRSTIQVLEYARSLDTYNQYGKADIDKNIAWLENQDEQKDNNKLIWKHWSGCGIAGNGDGTQIYLIKQYNTYSVCSCLSSECDYILLSDLDKLISDGDVDVRYKYLEDILAADDIYQMSMNDTMVEEAKSKASEALSKMSIGKLLGIKNQDEQKPINKIELKFHEGDWVVLSTSDGEKVVQIDSIEYFKSGEPRYITSEGKWFGNGTKAHLWNIIQDAKDGDVLVASDGSLFIFTKLKDNSAYYHFSLCKNGSKEISVGKHALETANSCYPATESQRDTLLKAMTDAGYEWDAEKKELRLFITNCDDFFESENCEQKPAEWNQENIEELTEFENAMMHIGSSFFGDNAGLDPNDTDTIKEQAELLLKLAPKTEWSEEDEKMVNDIIAAIDTLYYHGMVNWLKSLKERYTWKPSDEQMEALYEETQKSDRIRDGRIVSLYNDLKKLREE